MNQNANRNNTNKLINKYLNDNILSILEKDLLSLQKEHIKVSNIDDNQYTCKAKLNEKLLNNALLKIENADSETLLVLKRKKDRFEVIIGREYLLAAKSNDVLELPAVVINVKDEEVLLTQLVKISNQLEPNVVEIALVCYELTNKFHYSQSVLSKLTHQSRSQIANYLRLLNLPEKILDDVSTGKLGYGHAKAIASLPTSTMNSIVDEIYNYSLSVREVEHIVKRYKASSEQFNREENVLNRKYKTFTSIKRKSVTFTFDNEEDRKTFIRDILEIKD